ncbi:MAG: hypothetical protein ABF263_08900 [Polaribacter sp.]
MLTPELDLVPINIPLASVLPEASPTSVIFPASPESISNPSRP